MAKTILIPALYSFVIAHAILIPQVCFTEPCIFDFLGGNAPNYRHVILHRKRFNPL